MRQAREPNVLAAMGMPRMGQVIERKYRVERLLGAGGMGAVFAATHVITGKQLALKWLLPGANEESGAEQRLLREAQATARIDHPNVVNVFDVGRHESGLYLVMELLRGQSLGERMDHGRLEPNEAVALLMPALRGVAAAHAQGVVHRDLKPDNVFLCVDRHGGYRDTKVLDFGISKLTNGEELSLTATGMLMGTPCYMAPEQIRGKSGVDIRQDVYAIGVILYELLADGFPFEAQNYSSLLFEIVMTPPKPLAVREPSLPQGLCAVVMRAIAKRPEDRYQDVASLAAELEPYANGVQFEPPTRSSGSLRVEAMSDSLHEESGSRPQRSPAATVEPAQKAAKGSQVAGRAAARAAAVAAEQATGPLSVSPRADAAVQSTLDEGGRPQLSPLSLSGEGRPEMQTAREALLHETPPAQVDDHAESSDEFESSASWHGAQEPSLSRPASGAQALDAEQRQEQSAEESGAHAVAATSHPVTVTIPGVSSPWRRVRRLGRSRPRWALWAVMAVLGGYSGQWLARHWADGDPAAVTREPAAHAVHEVQPAPRVEEPAAAVRTSLPPQETPERKASTVAAEETSAAQGAPNQQQAARARQAAAAARPVVSRRPAPRRAPAESTAGSTAGEIGSAAAAHRAAAASPVQAGVASPEQAVSAPAATESVEPTKPPDTHATERSSSAPVVEQRPPGRDPSSAPERPEPRPRLPDNWDERVRVPEPGERAPTGSPAGPIRAEDF